MTRYLSAPWLAAAQAGVAAVATGWPVDDLAPIGITQVVDGGPDGTVTYHLSTHAGADGSRLPRLASGPAEPEDVRLRTTWTVAMAVARGDTSGQRAFVDGDIVLTGDAASLVGAQRLLVLVDGALAPLRATTTYPDHEPPRR